MNHDSSYIHGPNVGLFGGFVWDVCRVLVQLIDEILFGVNDVVIFFFPSWNETNWFIASM